jgi:hypothetical protein
MDEPSNACHELLNSSFQLATRIGVIENVEGIGDDLRSRNELLDSRGNQLLP